MRAAWFERFGAARDSLQLGERETPAPAPGEVRVRVTASRVNPSDVKKRAGSFPDLLADGYVIPHSDGAGRIDAVGEGVDPERVGQRVWLYQAQFERRFGTAAEYVCVPACRAVPLPDQADDLTGACMGIPAMIAHRCVYADGPVDGRVVLVTGGAGRAGGYAIQWAKLGGATVIATAGDAAGTEDCLRAGADQVVNHRSETFTDEVQAATGGAKLDRVIDVEFGANLSRTLDLIKTGGVIATYASTRVPEPELPFFRMMYLDLTIHFVIVYAMPEAAKSAAINDITGALEAGRLVHRIAHWVPLAEIAHAHELVEQGGFRGQVVVEI